MNDSKLKVYQYPQCGTCRSAVKWLKEHGWDVETVHIVEQPPTVEELREIIPRSGLDIKKWFNVSGEVYKELGLKDKLPGLSEEEKIALLASNGKLIKRPVVISGSQVTVGFKADQYEEAWGSRG
ncbi:arsenate reductase family protein [Paenibacillus mucilaginosus]|uniref:YusI n=2 Tax=Paenibacillus mucilaginosus TaxID=61624 RepID=H6NGF4_9BACL|nr:arsenate reductase family protein [Paenibacillus mucilaginosus]AEI45304.1 YusI [Paenibacillus mucilaginosus KNP414]AFC33036.1 YusI [Paenibacillus mucilaginosus 3016]MCG7212812.1 arsenate reductase family protein [Paenibacillus mucilaginosus]WDM26764.1 arsenate reductase family protein [Paenibacillus mucilaginosus]WFA21474.1 arsenate reductase family protein [Paenibacillus mucilaginosus]